MKKLSIIISAMALWMIQSCQQPEADQATIDSKVTETYQAKKTEIENNAATACEDAINAKVKSIQDSMSTMNAAQQAAAMAKMQKELKIEQAKATKTAAAAKKKAASPKDKPSGSGQPVLDEKGNQQGTPTTRGDGIKEDKNIKLDEKGNQQGTPTTR